MITDVHDPNRRFRRYAVIDGVTGDVVCTRDYEASVEVDEALVVEVTNFPAVDIHALSVDPSVLPVSTAPVVTTTVATVATATTAETPTVTNPIADALLAAAEAARVG